MLPLEQLALSLFFFKLRYSGCTMLYTFQVYNIGNYKFENFFSIYIYYKILAIFLVIYNISL